MGKFNQPTAKQFDSQEVDNWEHDHSLRLKKVMPYEQDGVSALAPVSKLTATEVRTSSPYTYIGKAPIGTATSATGWQVKRLDTTNGVSILWADANANFDNIFNNYASLTYA